MLTDEHALSKIAFRDRSLEITRSLGRLDLNNLREEVSEVGGESIWWGTLAAQAQADAERAKLQVDVTKAQVGRKIRQDLTVRNERITEDKVEELVKLSEEYQAAMHVQIEAFEKAGTLHAVRFAVDRKQKTLEGLTHLLAAEIGATAPGNRAATAEDRLRENMRDHMTQGMQTAVPRGRGRPPGRRPAPTTLPSPAPKQRQAAV